MTEEDERREVADATTLAATRRGAGRRLVLVHGFSQTGACWGPVAADLAATHELVLVDAPGHGGSSSVRGSFADGAARLATTGGVATYVGYSMGGRYVLALALARPDLVTALVLIGASAGLASADERSARAAADESLADHLLTIGLPAFLDEWLARPLFAGLTEAMRFRAERLANAPAGLASSLRLAGTGAQPSLGRRLPELTMPVLLVTGALDTKFTTIAAEMTAAIGPNAAHVILPDAGHTAHLENPDAFLATLREWLATTATPTP